MVRPDPTEPGVTENYEHAPPVVPGQRIAQICQYTHTNQFAFFRDWINFRYNNDCNVRIDPDDKTQTCIRWYWDYYLPLGWFLINGKTVYDEAGIRWLTAPFPSWPEDEREFANLFYEPGNPPIYDEWPEV